MQWENVYIFISSTFNDMHAERDYLVKSVFPALSEWCEARKLRLIDIDLRWGVTAADSEAKNTVRACLRNIDECRPFFLCFMGQRRGWMPNAEDIGGDTYDLFPNLLEKRYVGEASVTEMEILHALIDPLHNGVLRGTKDDSRSGQAVEHAFFYLRDPGYLDNIPHSDLRNIYTNEAERDIETADRELARWRDVEIPRTGRPVYSYTAEWRMDESTPEIALPLCVPTTAPKDSDAWRAAFARWRKRWAALDVVTGDSGEISGAELEKANAYNKAFTGGRLSNFTADSRPLSELVIEQLKAAIVKRFPDHMTTDEQTPLQKELDQQAQFLRIAADGFIERAGDFDALNEYLKNDEKRPFALTAYAGMGKTSLLAHFIDVYSVETGGSLHYRFIGGSDDSVSAERLIRSLLGELKESGKVKSVIPANSTDMMNKLPDLLAEAGKSGKTVVVIDALNQLESGMSDLYWIPSVLPDRVKMIVSFKRGEESADGYYRHQEESGGMVLQPVKLFDSAADRKALVSAYLEQYFKELDEPRIQSLINSDGAVNPLFLKAALSELRVFGVHNDLAEVIRSRFGNTPVTAFGAILSRMESDAAYTKLTPAAALPHVFGWIAHSRYGLAVDELADLLMRENLTDSKTDALDAIYLIIRQLRPFLAKRDGRVDFFYESFKIAAAERYTGEHPRARQSKAWHKSLAAYFETLPLTNRHRLMEQAWQYARAGMDEKYKSLLYDYSFIDERLGGFGVADLISDYAYSDDAAVKLLRDCHTLSAHILALDGTQLASQLWGRMADFEDADVQRLLKQAVDVKKERGEVWLRPKKACMPKPGGALARILPLVKLSIPILMPDGVSVAFADGATNRLTIMEIQTGKIIKSFSVNPLRLAVTEDGKRIAFVSASFKVGLCDLQTGDIKLCEGSTNTTLKPAFVFSGNIAVTRTYGDAGLRVWDISGQRCVMSVNYGPGLNGVALTADGARLISGYDDNTVRIWSTCTGECLHILNGHTGIPTTIFLDEQKDIIYSFALSSVYMNLIAFRLSDGGQLFSRTNMARSVEFSSDKQFFVYHSFSSFDVVETQTGNKLRSVKTPHEGGIRHLTLSPDGKTALTMGDDKAVILWNVSTGESIGTLLGHSGNVTDAMMTVDGRYVLSSAIDCTLKIWDVNLIGGAQTPTDTVKALSKFSDDEIVVHSERRGVAVYGFAEGDLRKAYPTEYKYIYSFDADLANDRILINCGNAAEIRTISDNRKIVLIEKEKEVRDKEFVYGFYNAKLMDNGRKIITIFYNRAFIFDAVTGDVLVRFPVANVENWELAKNGLLNSTIPSTSEGYEMVEKWELFDNRTKLITYCTPGHISSVWDLNTQRALVTFSDIKCNLKRAGLLPDESAFMAQPGDFRRWDTRSGDTVGSVRMEMQSAVSKFGFYNSHICFTKQADYSWIYNNARIKCLALFNYKTGQIAAYFLHELDFETCVCTPDGEHVACINRGDLSFLHLENMAWPDISKCNQGNPAEASQPVFTEAHKEQPEQNQSQTAPAEKPKGFLSRLFGKK